MGLIDVALHKKTPGMNDFRIIDSLILQRPDDL